MTFDEIEERNEAAMLGAGYPESLDAWEVDGLDPDRLEDILAYSLDDPKHPDHREAFAASWDMRGGK